MPKREDEYWAAAKSDLRYCPKHKRYYKADVGCQLCYLEKASLRKEEAEETLQLQKCPVCREMSLFWNAVTKLYECLNTQCQGVFTEPEMQERLRSKIETWERQYLTSHGWVELETGEWYKGGGGLDFVIECSGREWKVRRSSGKHSDGRSNILFVGAMEQAGENVDREIQTAEAERKSGKTWFRNEYYDPEDRKWKKPKKGILHRLKDIIWG